MSFGAARLNDVSRNRWHRPRTKQRRASGRERKTDDQRNQENNHGRRLTQAYPRHGRGRGSDDRRGRHCPAGATRRNGPGLVDAGGPVKPHVHRPDEHHRLTQLDAFRHIGRGATRRHPRRSRAGARPIHLGEHRLGRQLPHGRRPEEEHQVRVPHPRLEGRAISAFQLRERHHPGGRPGADGYT